jgi:NAD(P)-dependent dehydrogenase (short-subunit alcohol dehydrogenase family)
MIPENDERMRDMNLTEKVVLITGSSSGIGRATAIRFAREGSRPVVNYHVNRKGAEETRGEIIKRWVTDEEVAEAFVFLAKNDGITGQVIYVDGGFTLK